MRWGIATSARKPAPLARGEGWGQWRLMALPRILPVDQEPRCRVFGVVLAGGLARRMGGGDKPLRLLAGRPMLDHVLERLRPQVAALALSANGDGARFAAWGLPVLADPLPDFPGPLAGILAGMEWVAAQGGQWMVSAPGDSPLLPGDYVASLWAARRAAGGHWPVPRAAARPTRPAGYGILRCGMICVPPCWPAKAKSVAGPPGMALPMPHGRPRRLTLSSTSIPPLIWPRLRHG